MRVFLLLFVFFGVAFPQQSAAQRIETDVVYNED